MKKVFNKRGITLIALVVTIVVLIIIAGITINATIGENGFFRTAEKKQEQIELRQLKEDLEIDKQHVTIENNGKISIESFKNYIKNKYDVSEMKEENKENLYNSYVKINGKYVFLLKQENDEKIDIIYMGIAEEMPPILNPIEITEVKTNRITINISIIDLSRNTK